METAAWEALYEDEARVRAEISLAESLEDRNERLRAWWGAIAKLLKTIGHQYDRDPVILPEPFIHASRYLEELSRGHISDVIADVIVRGAPAPTTGEINDIRLAVAYHRAATVGLTHKGETSLIQDRAPTKSLAEAFGVSARTIRDWVSKYPPAEFGRNAITSELIESLARKAGVRYQKAGRSRNAVSSRNLKAAPK